MNNYKGKPSLYKREFYDLLTNVYASKNGPLISEFEGSLSFMRDYFTKRHTNLKKFDEGKKKLAQGEGLENLMNADLLQFLFGRGSPLTVPGGKHNSTNCKFWMTMEGIINSSRRQGLTIMKVKDLYSQENIYYRLMRYRGFGPKSWSKLNKRLVSKGLPALNKKYESAD